MLFGPDGLSNFFLGVFLFGLIFTLASLLLGFIGGVGGHGSHAGGGHGHDIHLDIGGHHAHVEVGGHGAHAGDGHAAVHDGPGILNMPTIMAFLTWFGGAGYIFRQTLGVGAIFAVPMAVISGVLGGGVMFVLLARVLWPMMTKPMSNADYSLPGTSARVVSSIREGGVGEIVYTKGGDRFTAGARSADENAIDKGTEVVILRYERGMAYVQSVDALLEKSEVRSQKSEI